ncbi:murein transglycosylase A [Pontixanthobacter sp.]|uniref:murein transglycosylase A n=1 Tax=Pontixanthobacter sp. TaxID=2792078 RepID=UPI003C7D967D
MRLLTGLASLALLSGCGGTISPSLDPDPPVSGAPFTSAVMAGVKQGPPVARLAIGSADAEAALRSFTESCPSALRREDRSGLTRPFDWQDACAAAPGNRGTATLFFATYFETAIIGSGEAFATGYFEPEIAGCRTRKPGCDVPVYALPDDLVRQWPADMPAAERTGRPPLGRIDDSGAFIPYFERAEIDAGALEGRGLAFAWAKDPVEMFFLQIQGSGRLALDDGTVMRIGYAGQNGRGYTGIGGVMRERGLLGDGPGQYAGSMQGIMQYIREHPGDGKALMQLNKSWIFFTELTGDGPLGSLGIPVRRESSVAVDPLFVPYGAPVFLDLDRDVADGLWIAQDTGGAIKGANRFDTFWGAGEDARSIAGGMTGRGSALILVPRGTVKRLNSQ